MHTPPVGQIVDEMFRALGIEKDPDLPVWAKDDPWWRIYDRCESPIEKRMVVALRAGVNVLPGEGEYTFEKLEEIAKAQPRKRALILYPQQNVLQYRVDFLLVSYSAASDTFRRAIIECDGHDYHLGNYQARIRDMKRDAALQHHRYTIFRFTGSQIFRAAPQLVERVADYFFGA